MIGLRTLASFIAMAVIGVNSATATSEVTRLVQPNQIEISQAHLKNNDACGPIAFLYMLKYSTQLKFKQAYENFPGSDFEEKAKNWTKKLYHSPSYIDPNNKVLLPHIGIQDFDLPGLVHEYVPNIHLNPIRVQPLRSPHESSGQNSFVKRIWSALKNQIDLGIPVVIGIYGRAYEKNIWLKRWGHTITITGIQKELPNRRYNFYFEYLDPWTGLVHGGFIGEELRYSFDTYIRIMNNRQVLVGKYSVMIPTVKEPISSPALTIQAPDLFLGYPAPGNKQELYIFDNLLFFEPNQISPKTI